MSLISINNWCGGLGNNLEQIVNAYWIAKSTSGQFSCNVDHHIVDVPKVFKFGNNLNPVNHGTANTVFLNKKIDAENKRFESYHKILQELSPKLFKKYQRDHLMA